MEVFFFHKMISYPSIKLLSIHPAIFSKPKTNVLREPMLYFKLNFTLGKSTAGGSLFYWHINIAGLQWMSYNSSLFENYGCSVYHTKLSWKNLLAMGSQIRHS